MSTPNNQDRLLSDEELRNVLTDFTKRVRVETPDGYDYKTYVDFDEVLSVFNTQKRLYAESVIGEKGTRLSKLGNTLCDELIDEQRARIK